MTISFVEFDVDGFRARIADHDPVVDFAVVSFPGLHSISPNQAVFSLN